MIEVIRGEREREPAVQLEPDTPADCLVSAGMWTLGLSWLIPMLGIQTLLHRVVEPDRIQWLERLYTRGQVALTGSRWRAVVDPAVDPARPYLFFQNHVSQLDHCTLYCATPHFKQGIELESHFRLPFYGWFMRSRGTIAVNGQSPAQLRQLIRDMRAELSRGHSLIVFPEGTRTLDGRLGPFKPGVFRIAQQLGAPIVPVTTTGVYRVLRKGSKLIRPGFEITVYCDAPIETAHLGRRDVPRLMQQVRDVMSERLGSYWRNSSPRPFSWLRSRRERA